MNEIQTPFTWRGKPVFLEMHGNDAVIFVCDGDALNCLSVEWVRWASEKIKGQAPCAAAAMVKE